MPVLPWLAPMIFRLGKGAKPPFEHRRPGMVEENDV